MTRKLTVFSLLAVMAAIVLLASCGQEKKTVLLRFKYVQGQIEDYHWMTKRHVRKTENDSVVKEGAYIAEVDLRRDIKRVLPDSSAEILQTSTWHITWPEKTDSTQTDTTIVGRKVTFWSKPDGRFVDFEFPPDSKFKRDTAYYRNFFEQAATVFPNRPIRQGETWTHSTTVLLNDEPVEAYTNYSLHSFARERGYDCAVIEYEGEMVIPISPKEDDEKERQGVDRTSITGMLYFAYTEGLIVSSRERMTQTFSRSYIKDGEQKHYKEVVEADGDFKLISVE